MMQAIGDSHDRSGRRRTPRPSLATALRRVGVAFAFAFAGLLSACGTVDAPVASPSPAPDVDAGETTVAHDVARLVNEARSQGRSCGSAGWFEPAPPLTLDPTLTSVAQAHSVDQAQMGDMTHTGSDGSDLRDRVNAAGYAWTALGENVAWNYRSAQQVMAGWLASDGHCRNIMNPAYAEIGVGLEAWYWTQVFARP